MGCGTISDAYLQSEETFNVFRISSCADIDVERAERKADEHGIPNGCGVEELLSNPEIDMVVNLTPPAVHADVCRDILKADKHIFVEKPLAISTEEATSILAAATDRGLLVGSAPDTFLGAGLQTCRAVLDSNRIGEPIGAMAVWTSPGHEQWHPNPDFFYQSGGGPLFDMGPYYLTALVFLLGPAATVAGLTTAGFSQRRVESEPRHGETIDVEVPTYESGLVTFENGAIGTILTSFDVQASSLPSPAFEIHGTEGTLRLPDPNQFGGPVEIREAGDDEWKSVPLTHSYTDGRGIGVADLAYAIRDDWEQRATGNLAAHVLEIAEGIRHSSDREEFITIDAGCDRPSPLPSAFPDGRSC